MDLSSDSHAIDKDGCDELVEATLAREVMRELVTTTQGKSGRFLRWYVHGHSTEAMEEQGRKDEGPELETFDGPTTEQFSLLQRILVPMGSAITNEMEELYQKLMIERAVLFEERLE